MPQPYCIFIVDDEPEIREMLRVMLEQAGYRTEQAENGEQAVARCRAALPPDLVVMDVSMPRMDGIEACRRIRQNTSLPVILLTVRDEEEVLLAGFSAGANDFLAKPFRPRELRARVAALLQRTRPAVPVEQSAPEELAAPEERSAQADAQQRQPQPNGRLTYADISLNPRTREVRRGGRPLNITNTGVHLLSYFMRHPGEVISKERLLRDIWSCTDPKANMVEAAIKRLRKELGDNSRQPRYIKTVWGTGYRFGE